MKKIFYMCDKGGKPRFRKNKDVHESKRHKTGSQKCNCPFIIVARELKTGK